MTLVPTNSGDETPDSPSGVVLPTPAGAALASSSNWTLTAYDKRVLAGWILLAASKPANARHCFEWLSNHPTRFKRGRCYPLRGHRYTGIWAYEIGSGDRVYYKPFEDERKVVIYYAGPHPPKIPEPPSDI